MKNHFMCLLISCFFFSGVYAQQAHPEQATPFKNVITAFKTDSVSLFINSFSKNLDSVAVPLEKWKTRLQEGKRKFKRRFGEYNMNDFSFKFITATTQLQVFFKNQESFKIRVQKEDNEWKLNQH